jgi:hypothetical protein
MLNFSPIWPNFFQEFADNPLLGPGNCARVEAVHFFNKLFSIYLFFYFTLKSDPHGCVFIFKAGSGSGGAFT